MIKKILKKLEKRGIKYCLSLLLVVVSVDFLLTRSWVCLLRAIEGIRNLALSFVCYFAFIFNRQTSIETPVNKLPNIRIQDYLPFSIEEVLRKIDALPAVFFDFDNFKNYLVFVVQNLSLILMWFMTLGPCAILLFNIFFEKYTRKHVDTNKGNRTFMLYEKLRRFLKSAIAWVKSYITYLREHKKFFALLCVLWLINVNAITIILEFISWYLYFIVSFDFSSFGIQLGKLVYDLIIMLWTLPLPVWCIIGYVIFDICRTAAAYKSLNHKESKNCGFVKSHPPVVMAVGTVGAGKTKSIVDQALSLEVCQHDSALALMDKNMLRFPEFDFQAFETSLRGEILAHRVKNLATARRYIRQLRYDYGRHPDPKNIWGYDVRKYKKSYNNGLELVSIWKCLENYAQEYFIYSMKVSLILSNIAVRSDILFIDEGYFEIMKADFFKRDPAKMEEESKFAHIIDWDLFRIGCQMNKENAIAGSFEFGVIVASEIGKERRNSLELKKVKNVEGVATQHNDAFNDWLKVMRHQATVEGICFIIFLCDEQRPESWGADARDLCIVLHIIKISELKLAIRFCFVPQLVEWFMPKYTKWYHEVKQYGNENAYFVIMLHTVMGIIFQYAERKKHIFGYQTQILGTEAGDMIDSTKRELKEHKYFLMLKKIYSRRYATDAFKDIFATKALESDTSFYTLPTYESDCARLHELQLQNSYMVNTFLCMFNPEIYQQSNVPK